jgi:hypothetical protein
MDVTRRRLLAGLATAGAASMCSPLLQNAAGELTGPARLYPPMDLSLFDTPVDRGAWRL